ncbi:hypothetical protein [Micromonospora mirobrigensis]|nr:hypothetical protein [Micromonospora mirobrigensis]
MADVERDRITRGRRRFRLLAVGAVVVLAIAGFVIGAITGGDELPSWRGNPPGWAENAGLALVGLGLLGEAGWFVYGYRSGRFKANRESRIWAVSWSRRRELAKQVRRDEPAAGEDPAVLRNVAEQMAGGRWLLGLYACMMLFFAGQALSRYSWFWTVLLLVMAALFVVAAVSIFRDARRAEAFLRHRPVGGGD